MHETQGASNLEENIAKKFVTTKKSTVEDSALLSLQKLTIFRIEMSLVSIVKYSWWQWKQRAAHLYLEFFFQANKNYKLHIYSTFSDMTQ